MSLKVNLIKSDSIFLNRNHKNQVYSVLFNEIDCGPFDGGCLVFAMAMTKIYEGNVHVIVGKQNTHANSIALHAIFAGKDGRFADADGWGTAEEVISRFVKNELPFGKCETMHLRPWQKEDLPDAPYNDGLVDRLAFEISNPAPYCRKKHVVF